MRQYPLEFEKKKLILFHPSMPKVVTGDYLEIGPGNGEFLLSLAESRPGEKIVALELSRCRFHKLARKLERRQLHNVILIGGNARVLIPRFLSECAFERIYILFPDPWLKRRHAPHRLLAESFLAQLAGIMRDDGELYFATDVAEYARWVINNIDDSSSLRMLGSSAAVIQDYRRTFFEQIARENGSEIFYVAAGKMKRPPVGRPSAP